MTKPKSKTRSKRKASRKPTQAPKQATPPEDPSSPTTEGAEKPLVERMSDLRDQMASAAEASNSELFDFISQCRDEIVRQSGIDETTPREPDPKIRLRMVEAYVETLAEDLAPALESLGELREGFARLEATISGFQGMHPRDIPSTCSNCRFYAREHKQPYPRRRGRPDMAARLDDGIESGMCRRRPPEAQVGFPRVLPETWCGEWEA